MRFQALLGRLVDVLSFSAETWMSIFIGVVASFGIAYLIYRLQKKETILHKRDHDARLDELKLLHQQDSEKIRLLYDLILQSQKGSLGEVESALLEQKIDAAADDITEQDSTHAQALKAIADKQKEQADDLLDQIAREEHSLEDLYKLRAVNERRNGFYAETVKWYQKISELKPDNLVARLDYLDSLLEADRPPEAREQALQALSSLDKANPDNDEFRFRLYNVIILSMFNEADASLAEPYLADALQLAGKLYGDRSQQMSDILNELGTIYNLKGQCQTSEQYFLKALAIEESLTGKENSAYRTQNNLANCYRRQGRYKEALPLLEKSFQYVLDTLGNEHPTLLYPLLNLASTYIRLGNFHRAEALILQAKEIVLGKLGTGHVMYVTVMQNQILLYMEMKRYAEAEAALYRAD